MEDFLINLCFDKIKWWMVDTSKCFYKNIFQSKFTSTKNFKLKKRKIKIQNREKVVKASLHYNKSFFLSFIPLNHKKEG